MKVLETLTKKTELVIWFLILTLLPLSFFFRNTQFFEIISWPAVIVLTCTSIPQIILNWKRKSTEGVSWLMFEFLLFGMGVMFVRSLAETNDLIIRFNYGFGSFLSLLVNVQIFYYRHLRSFFRKK